MSEAVVVKKYVDHGTESTMAFQFQPGMQVGDLSRFLTCEDCHYTQDPEGDVVKIDVQGAEVNGGDWVVKYANGQFDVRSDERFLEEFEPR